MQTRVRPPVSYLSIAETANLLRVSQSTVRRAIRRGELPRVRVGRVIRVNAEDINRHLRMDVGAHE